MWAALVVEDKCELDCRGSQEIVGRSRLMLHNLPGRDVRLSEKEEERGKSLTSSSVNPSTRHPPCGDWFEEEPLEDDQVQQQVEQIWSVRAGRRWEGRGWRSLGISSIVRHSPRATDPLTLCHRVSFLLDHTQVIHSVYDLHCSVPAWYNVTYCHTLLGPSHGGIFTVEIFWQFEGKPPPLTKLYWPDELSWGFSANWGRIELDRCSVRWILAELSGFEWIRESDLSDDVAGLEHLSISPQQCGPSSHDCSSCSFYTLEQKRQNARNCLYRLWRIVFTHCGEKLLMPCLIFW